MADQEMQDAPDMMSLNDALALMRATAAAGGSAKLGPELLSRLVEHVIGLQAIVSAPRGTDAQIQKEREIAAAAIDGALAFGYQGTDAPEAGHWLLGAHNAGARIAELETERNELIDQRNRGDAQNDLLLAELRQVNTERDELRARLAEAEEPAALVETSGPQGAAIGWTGAARPVGAALYARPVPAIPDGEQLTCDVCGVVCRDPWHYSAGDRRHMHACDSCWPGIKAAPEAAR